MIFPKEQFLDIFPYFRNTPDALVNDILTLSRYQSAPENLVMKVEGDVISEFVLLLSGEKRVYKKSGIGREITLYEMEPGDICVLNASCLLSNTRLPANAATMTKVGMLLLTASDFHDLMTRYADMRSFVFGRMAISFSLVLSLLSEVTFGKMDERLANYLIEKSENNILRTTHQKIADDLGTSREVVSRLLKNLQMQGDIHISRNFIELKNLLPFCD